MNMLNKRLQVLIDHERYRRLLSRARERKTSVGALVREAIDKAFPSVDEKKRRAVREILAAPRIAVPDPAELKRELEEIRYGRWSSSTPRSSSTR